MWVQSEGFVQATLPVRGKNGNEIFPFEHDCDSVTQALIIVDDEYFLHDSCHFNCCRSASEIHSATSRRFYESFTARQRLTRSLGARSHTNTLCDLPMHFRTLIYNSFTQVEHPALLHGHTLGVKARRLIFATPVEYCHAFRFTSKVASRN